MSSTSKFNFRNIETWTNEFKYILLISVFIFILLLAYYFDFHHQRSICQNLRNNIYLTQKTIADLKKKSAQTNQTKQQLINETTTLTQLLELFPQYSQLQPLLERISKIANDVGLQIQLFKPLSQQQDSYFIEQTFQLSIQGNYQQITRFLNQIASLNKMISLDEFDLKNINSDFSALRFDTNLKIHCYKYPLKNLHSSSTQLTTNSLNISEPDFTNFQDPFTSQKTLSDTQNFLFDSTHKPLLTMKFQDIPVRVVLQKIAEIANINIVISDHINSTISLQLKNVSWQRVLDLILLEKGLIQRKIANVYLIIPAEEISGLVQKEVLANQRIVHLEPLDTALIPVQYANANDIVKLLHINSGASILSERGVISADERTNTIWLQEISTKFSEIRHFIQQLDVPAKQVLIEARIVSVDQASLKELGLRFGINKANVSGSLAGANYFSSGQTTQKFNPLQDISQRLNVDLPVSVLGSGSIGLALAKLGSGVLLDLELSALQNEGKVQIIASPRLITANQKEALIQTGEEIPFQQTTSSGGTSVEFKKAVLSLKVTPRITLKNSVLLTLIVNQDKRGAEVLQGVPAIDTQEITTQVLVNNGQTIVIGGVYRNDNDQHTRRVPFLSQIPVVGKFFQYQKNNNRVRELMIFITPKIVKQSIDES